VKRFIVVSPRSSKQLLADALLALNPFPVPYSRSVSVDLHFVASGPLLDSTCCAADLPALEGAVYVVRSTAAAEVHIISGTTITQAEANVVHGLVNLRMLAHRPGGSIRVELVEEHSRGEFSVRRGRIYHRNAMQYDVLEVEATMCDAVAQGEALLDEFVRAALPERLLEWHTASTTPVGDVGARLWGAHRLAGRSAHSVGAEARMAAHDGTYGPEQEAAGLVDMAVRITGAGSGDMPAAIQGAGVDTKAQRAAKARKGGKLLK